MLKVFELFSQTCNYIVTREYSRLQRVSTKNVTSVALKIVQCTILETFRYEIDYEHDFRISNQSRSQSPRSSLLLTRREGGSRNVGSISIECSSVSCNLSRNSVARYNVAREVACAKYECVIKCPIIDI